MNLQIVEYNIPRKQYTKFSNNLQSRLPLQWMTRPFPITNVTFDPNNENVIILHDDTTVYVINKNKELPEKKVKIPRRENGDIGEDSNSGSSSNSQHAFQVVKKYKVRHFYCQSHFLYRSAMVLSSIHFYISSIWYTWNG